MFEDLKPIKIALNLKRIKIKIRKISNSKLKRTEYIDRILQWRTEKNIKYNPSNTKLVAEI